MERINKMLHIIFILTIVHLTSCKNQKFEQNIIDYIENTCHFSSNDLCEIDLSKFVGQTVDSILIFDAGTIDYDISRVLEFNYRSEHPIKDETKRIMFLSNGKIIKEGDVKNNKFCFLETSNVLQKNETDFYFCKKYNSAKLKIERSVDRDANDITLFYCFKK